MDLESNIHNAFQNLFSFKLRSFLAVLGILVGTGSVVAMLSSGEMATMMALKQFEVLGTNLLAVDISESRATDDSTQSSIDLDKLLNLKEVTSNIQVVAPYTFNYVPLSYKGVSTSGAIIGATESLQDVIKISTKQGRFISDLDHYSAYAVIGSKIAKKINPGDKYDLINHQLRIGEVLFTIIGIADPWPQNSFFNQNIDHAVIIPMKSGLLLNKSNTINNVVMIIKENADLDLLQDTIKKYLNQISPGVTLFFRSAKELIESMQKQSRIFTLLLGLIGSISLLVGGIGVMNIMLVSVTERKREIGIRMAVGAKGRDIRSLFLIESVILAIFGGILGVLTGLIISYIIATIAKWDFRLFFWPPFIGFWVSVGVGIFFGLYPAHKASELEPIHALRAE